MIGSLGATMFDAIVTHGPTLFVGTTIVLALGLLWARAQRAADRRRRLGIWTAVACGLYLAIAALPLPRLVQAEADAQPSVAAGRPTGLLPADVTRSEVIEALGLIDEPSVMHTEHVTPVTIVDSPAIRVTPPVTAPAIDWSRAIAMVYVGSAALLLLHHLLGLLRLGTIVRRARPAALATRRLADLSPATRLVVANRPVRPFCAGWLRPIVVLSPELEHRPELLAAVLRHEAAHLRARDPLVQTLFALLAVPLVLHPLFWWLRTDVRFQSEVLADQRAAGEHRTDYARELLHLVDRPAPLLAAAGTLAIFHRPSAFYRRIQMLLQPHDALSRPISRLCRTGQLATMLALVATSAGVFGVPATAQDPARAERRALEAERQVLRAQIAELRQQIADLSAELRRNAARLPIDPTTGLPGADRATAPRLDKVIYGRLDTETGEVTPLPPPGLPGEEVTEPPPPPPIESSQPVPQPAGVPHLSNIPILDRLFEKTPGAAGQPQYPSNFPAAPSAPVPSMASTAEGTVELTSRLLDLETEIEIAHSELGESRALAESKMISKSEIRRAEARLHNLTRKRDIVRGLVDGEIKATKTEIAWLSQQLRRAKKHTGERLQIEARMQRAEGRLQALRAAR